MKAAAGVGCYQCFPAHAKAMLKAAEGAGVANPVAWLESRFLDMQTRKVKGRTNPQQLVSMILQDARKYEPPPQKPKPPARHETEIVR
jgi:hypothetical protein